MSLLLATRAVQDIIGGVDAIKITMTPTASFLVGINLTFASGTLTVDWKDGSSTENFVSGVELTHTYVIASTYIAEITGDLENITAFIADTSRITNIENLKTGLLTQLQIQSNLLTTQIDLSNAPVSGTVWGFSNSGFLGFIFATSGNGAIIDIRMNNCSLVSQDLSNLTMNATPNAFYFQFNSGLTTLIQPSNSFQRLRAFRVFNTSIGFIDFSTNCTINVNNASILINNNAWSAAIVNQILVDLYSLVSGEGGGGDFTGRTINIGGTNASPDGASGGFDGLTAKANLEGKGFTVTI